MATQTETILFPNQNGEYPSSPITTIRKKKTTAQEQPATPVPAIATAASPVVKQEEVKPQKTSKDLWFLHGKYYDLEEFIPFHPGGSTVLKMSMGLEDATPLFESYHAFANLEYIRKAMKQYEIDYVPADAETRSKTETTYLFEENGFYKTVVRRVRAHFGSTKENESVTKRIKTNTWWNFKVGSLTVLYCIAYTLAFFVPDVPMNYLFAAAAGSLIFMIGFTAMHDASHYALGEKDSWKNKAVMRVWNSIALWDSAKWLYHHMVRHHSFTGDATLDPDIQHAAPMIRKHFDTDAKEYFRPFSGRWFSAAQTFFYASLLNYGQLIFYNLKWNLTGKMWNLDLSKTKDMFHKFAWEYLLSAFIIGSQVYRGDWLSMLAYWTAASVSYGMCILADHDTYESVIENHAQGNAVDWGEIQVRHSSDFAGKGMWGNFFGEVFGNINVQIGHHLFPSINHVHLRELIPIIQQTCEEFKIPYSSHDTLFGALVSVSKMLHVMNEDTLSKTKTA